MSLLNSIVYSVILKVWVFGGHTTNMYIVSSTMLDGSMERKKERKNNETNKIIILEETVTTITTSLLYK